LPGYIDDARSLDAPATGIASNNDVPGAMLIGVQDFAVLWRFDSKVKPMSAASWKPILNPLPNSQMGLALAATGSPSFKAGYYVGSGFGNVAALWDDRGNSERLVSLKPLAPASSPSSSSAKPQRVGSEFAAMLAVGSGRSTRVWLVQDNTIGNAPSTAYIRDVECGAETCQGGSAQLYASADLKALAPFGKAIAAVGSAHGSAVLAAWKGYLPAPGSHSTVAGTMTDLNSLIPVGTGWGLISAATIDRPGLIAGTGRLRGADRPFLLTPLRK
jgi:hypothetical protein